MATKLKINVIYTQKINLLLTYVISTFITRAIDPVLGSLMLFAIYGFLIAPYFPSSSNLQKLSLGYLIPIVVSPGYLVFRSLASKNSLTNFDLQIYLFLLLIFMFAFSYKNETFNFDLHKNNLKKIAAGFSSLFFLIIFTNLLRSKSLGHFVSWVMSGDSRGHVVFANDIANTGWLNISTFLQQPISAPTFMALFFSQENQKSLSIPDLLAHQLQIYSYMWIIFIALIGIISAATIELFWKLFYKTSAPVLIISLGSLLSLSSVVIGPATYDGFFTAVLSIASILVLCNWFIDLSQKQRLNISDTIVGFSIFIGSVLSWMFVGMFTFPLFLAGIWRGLLAGTVNKIRVLAVFAFGTFLVAAFLHFSEFSRNLIYKSKVALSVTGAISATNPEFYYFLILTLFYFGVASFKNNNVSSIFYYFGILNLVTLITFKLYSNLSFTTWNYYLLKYQWMLAATFFILLASFALVKTSIIIQTNEKNKLKLTKFGASISIFLVVMLLAESENPTKNALLKAFKGWENPRSSVVDKVFNTEFDSTTPTLFFHHGYDGDSKLANFWLTAYLTQQEPIRGWNYTIDTVGEINQMCEVNSYYTSVNIITYDMELEQSLSEACPNESFKITVENSPS